MIVTEIVPKIFYHKPPTHFIVLHFMVHYVIDDTKPYFIKITLTLKKTFYFSESVKIFKCE